MGLPIIPRFRLVGEVNGDSVKVKAVDNFPLLGFIWQSPWSNILIDAGIRRGIETSDGQFTTGLTFSFFLGSLSGK